MPWSTWRVISTCSGRMCSAVRYRLDTYTYSICTGTCHFGTGLCWYSGGTCTCRYRCIQHFSCIQYPKPKQIYVRETQISNKCMDCVHAISPMYAILLHISIASRQRTTNQWQIEKGHRATWHRFLCRLSSVVKLRKIQPICLLFLTNRTWCLKMLEAFKHHFKQP